MTLWPCILSGNMTGTGLFNQFPRCGVEGHAIMNKPYREKYTKKPKPPNSKCLVCGFRFYVEPSEQVRGRGIYCSKKCSCSVLGKKVTEKYKDVFVHAKNLHLQKKTHYACRYLKRSSCHVCGTFPADAHHEDYAKPFDVIWLCKKHHNQLHKNIKAA